MEMRKEKGSGSMAVLTPDPRSGSNKNHRKSIPQKRRKRYRVTLTRDFWGIVTLLATLALLPVLHMLLLMWGGLA